MTLFRWPVVRALLHKEALRHLANRGGLALVLLLVGAALLLSLFRPGAAAGGLGGPRLCYVDYWEDGPFVEHLRNNIPAELIGSVRFRGAGGIRTNANGTIVYPPGAGAIQLRPGGKVWLWRPGGDDSALAPYEAWLWREAYRFNRAQQGGLALTLEEQRSDLGGGLDRRSGLATALVLFGVFFVCVYLLPSLACEERERGVLLAQALSPATTGEILLARFLFYPAFGLALAAVLAGTYRPAVLALPFFWLALLAATTGAMGIGLTISSLARTQRTASMAALCYMMVVALFLFICSQNGVPLLPHLALEYHAPRMLHAALSGAVRWYHWVNLGAATLLAVGWAATAAFLFRRQGWQ
jgi:hypothetical protein